VYLKRTIDKNKYPSKSQVNAVKSTKKSLLAFSTGKYSRCKITICQSHIANAQIISSQRESFIWVPIFWPINSLRMSCEPLYNLTSTQQFIVDSWLSRKRYQYLAPKISCLLLSSQFVSLQKNQFRFGSLSYKTLPVFSLFEFRCNSTLIENDI
jgi:hypothetical protein